MNEIEDREGSSDGRKLDENGCEILLRNYPEGIVASERCKNDGEAEATDSEIVLHELKQRPY